MDFLSCLETFVAIADAGSISKAARCVGLSTPMASRHLRKLETELGAELVRRTTRTIQLTEAGMELLDRARRLLRDVEEAKQVAARGDHVAGTVIVTAPVALGLSQICPLLPSLLEKHPGLRIDLRLEDRVVDLLAENVDVAIRVGVPPDSTFLIARQLATFQRVLCASPAFLARVGPLRSPRDLTKVSCLAGSRGATRWRLASPSGPVEVLVHGRFATSNLLAIRSAAVAGLGVANIPISFVADDLQQRRLVRVLDGVEPPAGAVYGVFHERAHGALALRVFLDHLSAGFGRPEVAAAMNRVD